MVISSTASLSRGTARVTLLGTGTPTNPYRFQSAVLVETGSQLMLFDAGRGAVHQMHQLGIEIKRLSPVFITHHHVDHINDLFDVIVSSAMLGRSHELQIFGPHGTEKIVRALIEQVYAPDIRFRTEEANNIRKLGGHLAERPEYIARLDVRDIEPGVVYESAEIAVTAGYVNHGDFAHVPDFDWRCLGYRIEIGDKVLALSGDTVLCDGVVKLAANADLLIQCCHMPRGVVNGIAMTYLAETVLASSSQAGRTAALADVKHLALTHLSASINPKTYEEVLGDVRQHYAGPVTIGEDLLSFEL